jgi:hypothetical protein
MRLYVRIIIFINSLTFIYLLPDKNNDKLLLFNQFFTEKCPKSKFDGVPNFSDILDAHAVCSNKWMSLEILYNLSRFKF